MRDPDNDPAEMVRVRKLRLFPFLSPEEIASVAHRHPQAEVEDKEEFIEIRSNPRSDDLLASVGSDGKDLGVEVADNSNMSDVEDKQLIVIASRDAECMAACYPTNRANAQSRGIRKDRDLPWDNNLVTFDEFFNLMKGKADFANDDGIKFEQEEKNVSCLFFSW